MTSRIVVAGGLDGHLISAAVAAVKSGRTGSELVTLPYEPEQSPATSFVKRSWGYGVTFRSAAAERVSPVTIYYRAQRRFIYWRALFVATGPEPQGMVRLSTDPVPNGLTGRLTGESVSLAGSGEWVTGGKCSFVSPESGYLGLCLYGTARNVAVRWLAVSNCAADLVDW